MYDATDYALHSYKTHLADILGVRRQGAESKMRPLTGCSMLCCREHALLINCWLGLRGKASAAAIVLSTVPKKRKPALLHTLAC